ncbi:MAG: BamA/TamA family outer membrane protein [Longimicrobiales bacterium]|nr:BamA/TamA family outer membrane protein [Longimicrobiales bacterium]
MLGLALILTALVGPTGGAAQRAEDGPSLFLVDAETRIGSLRWSFPSGTAIPPARLKDHVAVRGPGALTWMKRTFDILPFVPSPQYAPFSPVVLQRDVVRLRRVYRNAGFPRVHVDYDVALDTTKNRVAITMIVDQGEPLTIDTVEVRLTEPTQQGDGGVPPSEFQLPGVLQNEWDRFLDDLGDARGERFGQEQRARLVQETTNWFLHRGYPWASVSVVRADTTETGVSLALQATPGARAKVREIRVEGNERLDRPVLIREVPIRVGDWYDARRIAEGERELYELDLIRRALGDVVESQPQDTTVAVRFRVNEGQPRLVWGRVGWRSESGMGGEAHWQHRDFLGGARAFTFSTNFESGLWALEATNTRTVGVSALVRQPYLFQRTLAGTFGPFARFRDDFRDRSLLFGVETSLLYRKRALETVTLQHELSRLRVDDTYQLTPIREVVQQGDSVFAPIFVKSIFKLTGAYGTLDDRINPGSGYLIEPNMEVTGPSGVSDVEFFRMAVKAMAVRPLNRNLTLFVRGSAGRLFPFGESDPEAGVSRTRAIVGLRDVMFTAGGTSDVRGWANGLMGSKIPDVSVDEEGTVVADRFVPAGGLARLTGSAELGMPFPFLSRPHRTYAFFDAGRVWSPGDVFDPADPELRRESWAYAVGGGLEFGTLVGPIRIGVGYKLNPIPVDLLPPGRVARAIVDGIPLDQLEEQSYRRWHLHLSIGRGF